MTTALSTHHWHRLHGAPLATGDMKSTPSDFIVEEILGFTPSGTGEHVALFIEKTNTNTAYVAEQLSKFTGLPLRDISYAGRKDKFALTRQWFTVYDKGRGDNNWHDFKLSGVTIKQIHRHNRKIKIGSHKGNRFGITIRNITFKDRDALFERIDNVTNTGFINYFGQQRFGEMRTNNAFSYNGNLDLAARIANGEKIRNRNKRNVAISAMRSWLFNEFASQRIKTMGANTILNGDVLLLSGSNSFFVCTDTEIDDVQSRLLAHDVNLSAPLWGVGLLDSKAEALQFETAIANECEKLTQALETLQLKQQRRAIIAFPRDVDYQLEGDDLRLSFELNKGCYATSLVREFLQLKHEEA